MDSFIDFDNFNSPSLSPNSSKGKAVVSQHPSISSASGAFASSQASQQIFSGPSHQYDSYKQQTGLPVGGLANTLAMNQTTNVPYSGSQTGFVLPQETFFPKNTIDDLFDFGRNPSLSEASDMDFDTESPSETLPAYLFPSASSSSSSKTQFVDPSAIGGQEQPSSNTTQPVQRMYPGMHSQQAAMAKAQQQQRQEMMRQQQQRQLETQRQQQSTKQNKAAAHHATDPIVEERISRLLHQMRQSSVGSQEGEDAATPTGNLPHIARLKKEEDDMDEDERLLASEEGKKLSSKERRQLRNKVSARAFRSRRKGPLPLYVIA